mgnify:CR=1 FL=1
MICLSDSKVLYLFLLCLHVTCTSYIDLQLTCTFDSCLLLFETAVFWRTT